ncbi:MAG: TetR family transcriptional regulator [Myxococcaceae bacterium]|nr:TetR family transcriptional regulator [Myxococcaceae bacterium]
MDRAKKECILLEAARAFGRFGFKKASVDDIAKGAGVAKGTVYLACESKEDLFYQVLHREVRSWVAETAKLIDPRIPADQLLVLMSQAGLEHLDSHPLVRDLLFGKTTQVLPNWSERLSELRSVGNANVVEVLRLGVRQGIFREDLDFEATASLLQDLQLTTFLFHMQGPDREERLLRRQRAAMALVMLGLRRAADTTSATTNATAATTTTAPSRADTRA